MARHSARLQPPDDVLAHDARGVERDRLDVGHGRLEQLCTHVLLERWASPAPAVPLRQPAPAGPRASLTGRSSCHRCAVADLTDELLRVEREGWEALSSEDGVRHFKVFPDPEFEKHVEKVRGETLFTGEWEETMKFIREGL